MTQEKRPVPLQPDLTLFLLIDPVPLLVSEMSEDEKQALSHRLRTVCDVAGKMEVPIILSALGDENTRLWTDVSLSLGGVSVFLYGSYVYLLMDACPKLDLPPLKTRYDWMQRMGLASVRWQQLVFNWVGHQPSILDNQLLEDLLFHAETTRPLIPAMQR